ncbi:TPA: hypothetical protein PVD63_002485 [Escherichia coli]|nr:hypothetical protein [Escherichia coli]
MSTITKEQAKDLRNAFECWQHDYDPAEDKEQYDMFGLGMVAMDALLSSLEAEAVGEVVHGEFDDTGCHPDARVVCIAADGQADWENFKDGTRLYTAPPAPVSVPEPIKRNDADGWWMYKGRRVGGGCAEWYNRALDDCRAAMLQGADTELQRKAAIHDALCVKYNVESLADFVEWQRNHIAELEAAPPAPVGEGESAVMPDYPGYVMTQRECFDAGAKRAVPDGWVAVPIEPTYQMCEAMGLPWESPRFPDRYKAMISAAPHIREISNSSTNNCRENAETSTNCPCCGRKPLKNKTCSVAGCDGKHVARGLCVKHYAIERKKDPSRLESIRAADKRYRARKAAAPQQEVK